MTDKFAGGRHYLTGQADISYDWTLLQYNEDTQIIDYTLSGEESVRRECLNTVAFLKIVAEVLGRKV